MKTIKVQLHALGLIKRSTKPHMKTDTITYWTLSDHGQNVMVNLRALRRNARAPQVPPG
jgi:hypothetical protein